MTTTTDRPDRGDGADPQATPEVDPPGADPSSDGGARRFGPTVRRLGGLLRGHRVAVGAVVLLGVVGVAASVTGPLLLGIATDVIVDGVPLGSTDGDLDVGALATVLAWAAGVYLTSAAFGVLSGRLLNRVVARVMFRLRADVAEKINRLPLRHCDSRPRGELLSRVTNDIDNVATAVQQTLSQLLTSLLTVVGVLAMMLVLSPLLTLIALAVIPLSGVAAAVIGSRAQRLHARQWERTGSLTGHVDQAFAGHDLVRVFGRRDTVADDFARRNDELYEAGSGAQFLSGLIMPAMAALSNVGYVVIAVVGGLWVASGGITLGAVQAVIQYSRQFSQPLIQIATMAGAIQSGVASAERVFEVLDVDEQDPDPDPAAPPAATRRGRVEFERVGFAYDPDRPLIEDLSFTVRPGQNVAVVGPTGAGKTTLVNLILRFYELDAGRITLDGVDVAAMRRADLRAQIGMVPQDVWLHGGTVRENIAYGRPDATDDQIVAATTATDVDHMVRTLPDGYDTVLGGEGRTLSSGEQQLITIARAFLADPVLLILDEATSSVDTRTEARVRRAMTALRASRTSVVIAHRLSTIRDADLILVVEDGRIVEQGTHDELLARRGAYHRLHAAQFAGAAAT